MSMTSRLVLSQRRLIRGTRWSGGGGLAECGESVGLTVRGCIMLVEQPLIPAGSSSFHIETHRSAPGEGHPGGNDQTMIQTSVQSPMAGPGNPAQLVPVPGTIFPSSRP